MPHVQGALTLVVLHPGERQHLGKPHAGCHQQEQARLEGIHVVVQQVGHDGLGLLYGKRLLLLGVALGCPHVLGLENVGIDATLATSSPDNYSFPRRIARN